ncbi:MAG TPA: NAD(P)/FAD-dependent oxidoreductase [Steroidobacteraceae bacterium]|jgi:flavin-dependent dehydrogenase
MADAATEVLVIGGGPAGSTIATLLARRGRQVTLIEKQRHPRFHIGESLLPANLPLLEELGVAEQVRAIGMQKLGAEFISHSDGREQDFRFCDAWDKSMPYAYHVRRSEFDQILLRNAAAAGASVIEGCRARAVTLPVPGGAQREAQVQTECDDGSTPSWRARFLIDASGRDTFLANHLGAKRRNRRHNSAALFAHFSGGQRHEGERAGHISIYWFEHGWFWFIPLHDGISSVGAVVWPYYLKSRTTSVKEFFLDTIERCPPLAQRLQQATLTTEVEATGNYAYSATHTHGDGYLLLGDAYAFVDPVFSTGVMLAMISAFAGADAVDTCLRTPERTSAALHSFDRIVRHGPREFSWFIYRVTQPTMRELFLAPRNLLRMKEAMLSVLAGDIFGRTPIWKALRAFKVTYLVFAMLRPFRSLASIRRRSVNIRPV